MLCYSKPNQVDTTEGCRPLKLSPAVSDEKLSGCRLGAFAMSDYIMVVLVASSFWVYKRKGPRYFVPWSLLMVSDNSDNSGFDCRILSNMVSSDNAPGTS